MMRTTIESPESPQHASDVLIWTDGFWCYRDQRAQVKLKMARDSNYRVIVRGTDEWVKFTHNQKGR